MVQESSIEIRRYFLLDSYGTNTYLWQGGEIHIVISNDDVAKNKTKSIIVCAQPNELRSKKGKKLRNTKKQVVSENVYTMSIFIYLKEVKKWLESTWLRKM